MDKFTRLDAHARIAGRTIKVFSHPPFKSDPLGTRRYACYAITGRGWRVGTLFTSQFTIQQTWDRAIAVARKEHPRAALHIIKAPEA